MKVGLWLGWWSYKAEEDWSECNVDQMNEIEWLLWHAKHQGWKKLKAWRVNKLYRTAKMKTKQERGMKGDLKSANEVVSWSRSVLSAETL